jgi:hypothetical protein
MVPQRNWEPLVNVHARLCYLVHAGIEVSSHDSLWNYTNILSSVDLFLKQFRCCLSKWSSNIYHLCWIKRAYHFHVWSLFCDLGSDCTHTSSLYVLCVKVKPWSFLVSRDSWLALELEIGFPCCWNAGVCSFALLLIHVFLNQMDNLSCVKKWMNHMTKWLSTQMHAFLLANVKSRTLAYRWYWEDLLNVKGSSTSWFY